MNISRIGFKTSVALLGTLAFASLAHAQATRTWVSGVGDDVNPCSRTAPCKTFAGAISKTMAGGEISVLDPGGFGAVTITKAITLNGEGTLGSILVSGVNGIVVQAGPNDVVRIIHLKIFGTSQATTPGINGINFIAGKQVVVEDSKIYDFNTSCINANGAGLQVTVLNSTLSNCVLGLVAQNGAHAVIKNSSITNNTTAGIQAGPGTGVVDADSNDISYNSTGAQGNGANSFVNLSENLISFNSVLGVNANGGGVSNYADCAVPSSGFTNRFVSNSSDGLIPSGAGICVTKK
jgi:hypothetical protein